MKSGSLTVIQGRSHHVGALLGPRERQRRVSRPLAVQRDVGVGVHGDGPGLHHQDRSN